MRGICCCLGAALVAAVTGGEAARAQEAPAVVVILDHSRSMWGPLEGTKQSKYLLARDAVRAGLRKLAPRTRVGVAAFGHRRNECSDVEVLRQPEPVDPDRLLLALEPLTPRGTGPLSLALREAVKSLPKDGGARSVVLVHDDADNCQSDLCAAGEEMRAAGITAHVVGLGTRAADLGKMACLPQLTGGRHFNALSPEQATAYIEEALRSAGSARGVALAAPAQPKTPQASIVAPEPIPATGPAALHLRALLAPNSAPLTVPLSWTVAAEDQPDVVLFSARAPNPVIPVAPGRYIVEAREGLVAGRQMVEVRGNRPLAVALALNAGSVRVRALTAKAAILIPDAVVSLSDPGGTLLHASKTGEFDVLFPAGRYMARVEIGLLRGDKAVTVTAGQQAEVDIALNVARLFVTTTGREPSSTEPLILSVVEDDPDAPQGRRELVRSAAQQASFVVQPGSYHAIARQGTVEARERVVIGPGEVRRLALNVAAGRLALATRTGMGETPGPEHVYYTVSRIDVAQEPVSTSLPTPTLLLPGGRYRVEGRYGLMNALTRRDVEVKAGQTVQLVLEPPVAVLRMRLTGAGFSETWWEVLDEAGRAVWMDGHAEATASLLAGRYRVRVESRDKRYERAIELRAGETQLLEIAAE